MMAKKKGNGREAWRRFYDPNATDEDYARWRDEHRQRRLAKAQAMVEQAITSSSSVAEQAHRTGLSKATVNKYRKGRFGKRGPLLVSFLMMHGGN